MNDLALFIPIISVIGFYTAVIIWLYFYFTTRNRIRMALIDSGKDASIFQTKSKQKHYNALKAGIVAFMAGVGILFGSMLERLGFPEEAAYLSMIFIFSGLGLMAFYWYVSKREKLEAPREEEEHIDMV